MTRKRSATALGLVMLAGLTVHEARAGQSFQFKPFVGPASFLGYDAFDPSLGTLDEVNVTIVGQALANFNTQPNFTGAFGAPVPYSFSSLVKHQWFNPGSKGFDFNGDAQLAVSATALGLGGPVSVTLPYSMNFKFTQSFDAAGLSPVSAEGILPPTSAIGKRDNFKKATGGFYELDMVNTGGTTTDPRALFLSQSHGGTVTLEYKYSPPPPAPTFTLISYPLATSSLLTKVSGQARYQDFDTGLLTETSDTVAEVRGSISMPENLPEDTVGARGSASIDGHVRSLSRAAGTSPADAPADPTLHAFTDSQLVTNWVAFDDSLPDGSPLNLDVVLRINGSLQVGGEDGAPPVSPGELFAQVTQSLKLFKATDPQWVALHEGGGTLDAATGLIEAGGWDFNEVSDGLMTLANIDMTLTLDDLFTVNAGEPFALELLLFTQANAPDAQGRFALADFFEGDGGVWLELRGDEGVTIFQTVAAPEPSVVVLSLITLAGAGGAVLRRRNVAN